MAKVNCHPTPQYRSCASRRLSWPSEMLLRSVCGYSNARISRSGGINSGRSARGASMALSRLRRSVRDFVRRGALIGVLFDYLSGLQERVEKIGARILARRKATDASTVGFGSRCRPPDGDAILDGVRDGRPFKSARHVVAWLGLTPQASGGKEAIGRVKKETDTSERCPYMAPEPSSAPHSTKTSATAQADGAFRRRPINVAATAVAHRTARALWAADARCDAGPGRSCKPARCRARCRPSTLGGQAAQEFDLKTGSASLWATGHAGHLAPPVRLTPKATITAIQTMWRRPSHAANVPSPPAGPGVADGDHQPERTPCQCPRCARQTPAIPANYDASNAAKPSVPTHPTPPSCRSAYPDQSPQRRYLLVRSSRSNSHDRNRPWPKGQATS
jgi:hypothetical protein